MRWNGLPSHQTTSQAIGGDPGWPCSCRRSRVFLDAGQATGFQVQGDDLAQGWAAPPAGGRSLAAGCRAGVQHALAGARSSRSAASWAASSCTPTRAVREAGQGLHVAGLQQTDSHHG